MMQIKTAFADGADQKIALPAYQTPGAAGADLRANLPGGRALTLGVGARVAVPTGLVFEIPQGFEIQLRPRSGLALRHGLTLLNSPGTIDSDYRGEVRVIMVNLGQEPAVIEHGNRIAQIIVAPVVQVRFVTDDLNMETARGTGGFGSTGNGD